MLRTLHYGHYVTDITLWTLRYGHYIMNYIDKLPEMKISKVALHSGRSFSCVMGHNEVEATHFQRYFSQTGVRGTK